MYGFILGMDLMLVNTVLYVLVLLSTFCAKNHYFIDLVKKL